MIQGQTYVVEWKHIKKQRRVREKEERERKEEEDKGGNEGESAS